MEFDARKIGRSGQTNLRRLAVQRVLDGESPKAVTISLKLGEKTIYVWLRKYRKDSEQGLIPGSSTGRPPLLNEKQKATIRRMIIGNDPRQYGLDFGLWTRRLIATLIFEKFNIEIGLTAVGRMLYELGITPQKPLKLAYQRDPKAVKEWVENTYPNIRKKAKKTKADIYFLDEAGVRSDSTIGKTWGEKGKKVTINNTSVRAKVSAISAVNSSGGFWYQTYTGKFSGEKFAELLKCFMKNKKNNVILILDGHPSHKSKVVKEYLKSLNGKLEFYFLPPYSPDLNPDEFVWNHLKSHMLPTKYLGSQLSIDDAVKSCLNAIKKNKDLVMSFFRAKSVLYIWD